MLLLNRIMVLFGFILAASLGAAAAPAVLTGQASVIDGDTLEIHGERVRLHGIDAPESSQLGRDAKDKKWRCGQKSALALDNKIGRRSVSCQLKGTDRYGRHLGICSVKNTDLNGWMVRQGWAVAYVKYSSSYLPQETRAGQNKIGLWQGDFVRPDQWRAGRRLNTATVTRANTAPANCLIKGNIGSTGKRIYHMPGMEWYDRTRISSGQGERWFCSEAEARAAGWRKAR